MSLKALKIEYWVMVKYDACEIYTGDNELCELDGFMQYLSDKGICYSLF